jgi:hypothetical protein
MVKAKIAKGLHTYPAIGCATDDRVTAVVGALVQITFKLKKGDLKK